MTALKACIELLDDQTDPKLKKTAETSLQRIEELLSALQENARARENRFDGACYIADLESFIAQASKLDFQIEGGEFILPMAQKGMEIILTQLLRNSKEHGATRIHIRGFETGLSFTDNGSGIDEIEKVFTPFYTTKRETGGTGMGLSIVENVLKAHGGRIEPVKVDIGARFDISFH